MIYRVIKKNGVHGTVLIIVLFSVSLSYLIVYFSHLLAHKEQPIISILMSIIVPLVSAPISYIPVNLFVKVRKREDELKKTNEELEKALEEVKELSGMLPICASCKKIRDDNGYWNQVEEYLSKKTDLTFSHGLCPSCYEAESKKIDEFLAKREKLNIKIINEEKNK